MKKTILTSVLLAIAFSGICQEVVKTQDGRSIVLKPDGTWELAKAASNSTVPSGVPSTANDKLVFGRNGSELNFNNAKWRKQSETPSRSVMVHKDGDGYAAIISERISIPLPLLKQVALENAKAAAPDAVLVSEEMRVVNGVNIMQLQMTGTLKGLPFVYLGYYHSGSKGSTQVITYTINNLFAEFKPDFLELLNGLVIKE
jgi:hypothetical protein